MVDEAKTFMIEDAQLIFRNFSGAESQFNKEGKRNFAVVLDPAAAEVMLKDGWNVKYLKPMEGDEEGAETPYISIEVGYKVRPPRVVMITSVSRTNLTSENVGILDWADVQTCDLIARAYEWEVNGKTGIKAYLQSMYITIDEDPLERKYALLEMENKA